MRLARFKAQTWELFGNIIATKARAISGNGGVAGPTAAANRGLSIGPIGVDAPVTVRPPARQGAPGSGREPALMQLLRGRASVSTRTHAMKRPSREGKR
jgi:hypothetical protein